MPPRYYKLSKTLNKYIKKYDDNECQNNENQLSINKIQEYFLNIIDSIILYSDMNTSITEIKSLLKIIQSKDEVYIMLDKIENIIESIVENINDNASVFIINTRIDYVRTLLSTLPNNCTEITYLILNILESLSGTMDFNSVHAKIISIKEQINTDFNMYDNIQLINFNLLNIISNIENGESDFIINKRIEYVQTLINNLL
jgi:hypothetical protein